MINLNKFSIFKKKEKIAPIHFHMMSLKLKSHNSELYSGKFIKLDCDYDENGDLIENVKYQNGKLNINKETSILGITEDVYNYYLGGYQVIDKWLKSHKGENLTIDSFNHIKKIVGIIEETIKIQEKLEKE